MKLFKTLALVGYGHSHFAQLDRLTSFGPENKLVEIGPSEQLNRSTRYPRRRGPPGTNVQSRPSSQIDDPRGAPGVAQGWFQSSFSNPSSLEILCEIFKLEPDFKARKWLKSDKEKIIRAYVKAARIPFTWDFDKQVDFISKDSILSKLSSRKFHVRFAWECRT